MNFKKKSNQAQSKKKLTLEISDLTSPRTEIGISIDSTARVIPKRNGPQKFAPIRDVRILTPTMEHKEGNRYKFRSLQKSQEIKNE